MLLSSIVETLDAELVRLMRLRAIVAELETPAANLVSTEGVAALLAKPVTAVLEMTQSAALAPNLPETDSLSPETEELPEPQPKLKRRRRKAAPTALEAVAEVPAPKEAELQEPTEKSVVGSEDVALFTDSSRVAEIALSSPKAKPAARHTAVQVIDRPKPSMVVVSATEAARERASRAARQPAKRARGEQHAAKPDAKPEDLARDLAARWLTGNGGAAELRGR